jgi:hypothetical protein
VAAVLGNLVMERRSQVESMLRVLEQSFPADALYARLATDHRPKVIGAAIEKNYRETIDSILSAWPACDPARTAFLQGLHLIEPFSTNPDLAQKIARERLQLQ